MKKKVVAIIPVREFRNTKLRLRRSLGTSERASLSRSLLSHVLTALENSEVKTNIIVASEKRQVSELARRFSKVQVISEERYHGGVNSAMEDGIAYALDNIRNMDSIMLIPSDLPFLSQQAANKAISELETHDLVLSPSAKRHGTSLMLFKMPQGKIPLHYDDNSYEQHLSEARKLKIRYKIYKPKEFLFDVDSTSDLRKLMRELNVQSLQELSRKLQAQN